MYQPNNSTPSNLDDFITLVSGYESDRLIDKNIVSSLENPYKIRAVSYLRVSTPGQAKDDKVSLSVQLGDIKQIIGENDWSLDSEYKDEGKSGSSIVGRDDFVRMIEDAKLGKFDVIVAWSADRLARNVDEMTQLRSDLRKVGVQITTVRERNEIIDPRKLKFLDSKEQMRKMLAYIQDWGAESEKRKLIDRFSMGKRGKAQKGLIPSKVAYGIAKHIEFINNDPKQKVETDVLIPEKIIHVRIIFQKYDEDGWGMRKIAEHLNDLGIPSPKGKRWCYSTIKYFLQNPVYVGCIRWEWRLSDSKESRARFNEGHQGKVYPGQLESTITREQYERVQEKIKTRAKMGGKAIHSKGLLSGIIKCGRCGGNGYFSNYPHWFAYKHPKAVRGHYKNSSAYMCSQYSQYGRSGCSARYIISSHKIEKIVVEKIIELSNDKIVRDEFIKNMSYSKQKDSLDLVESCESNLQKLKQKQEKIKEAYYDSQISLDEFQKDRKQVEIEILNASERLSEEKEKIEQLREYEKKTQNTISALTDFQLTWDKADLLQRKDLLQSILDKVVVNGDSVEIFFRE